MLVCVDGSGAFFDDTYATEMSGSFVGRIHETYAGPGAKIYHRGPDAGGTITNFTRPVTLVHRDILPKVGGGDTTLFLCGFSRGAGIVINAAALLHDLKVPVKGLFLFDAVARSVHISRADVITPNVEFAYHAMRAKATGSRTSFGNCGTLAAPKVRFEKRWFHTTHGAMGGTPFGKAGILDQSLAHQIEYAISTETQRRAMLAKYKIKEGFWGSEVNVTPEQEKLGMDQVEAWMWGHLRAHGVVS